MTIPRVWMIADRRGWAFDEAGQGISAALAGRAEIQIAYTAERTELSSWEYDLIYQLWWKGRYERQFTPRGTPVVRQVSSHRWREPRFGSLSPQKLAEQYLRSASMVTVPSQRLARALQRWEPRVRVTPKGFDPARYFWRVGRSAQGDLVAGWVGNANDPQKGLDSIVRPAATAVDLRIAAGDLPQAEMPDFYAGLDVILIASQHEGDPRPLIEGMASGCFPITTDVGIAPELVEHGVNGLVVPRTVEAFQAALAWCAAHRDTVLAAGRRNAAQMAAMRTWEHVAPAWLAAIHAALGARRLRQIAPRG